MKKIDPILLLLTILLVFFTGVLIFAEYQFPNDGQIYQTLAGLVSAISGALLMRVKPQAGDTKVSESVDTKNVGVEINK